MTATALIISSESQTGPKGWTREEYVSAVLKYLGIEEDEYYQTGYIQDLFKCSNRHACKLIDSNHIKGHRIPQSRHRRVLGKNLAEYIADNDYMDLINTEKIYKSGKLKNICKCSVQKIHELIRDKKMKAGKFPSSDQVYVTKETLVKFLEDYEIMYCNSEL